MDEILNTIPRALTKKYNYTATELYDVMKLYKIPGISGNKALMEISCINYIEIVNGKFLNNIQYTPNDIIYALNIKEKYTTEELKCMLFLKIFQIEKNRTDMIAQKINAPNSNYTVEDLKKFMKQNNIIGHTKLKREMEDIILSWNPDDSYQTVMLTTPSTHSPTISPDAPKRKPFTAQQRTMVWDKYIGENLRIGPCFACSQSIKFTRFEVGHVIAVARGGDNNIDNLRPLCFECNRSMGVRNLFEYKNELEQFKGKSSSRVERFFKRLFCCITVV